jgi:hypothetical protein
MSEPDPEVMKKMAEHYGMTVEEMRAVLAEPDADDRDWFAEHEAEQARAEVVDRIFEMVTKTIRKRFGLTIDDALDLLSDDRAEAERLI